ncbi:DinB family protein [Jannaschia seohaensis]|uniref:Putative damage-inducible protein DinB n=1 Tax=Jannaschia seohaensis TaxID=475081 RepID=A0A2Y9BZM2_9RHOB|nr:DinB family protein [Jannaschia seohaensis]PWJ20516.1 putative damage-inducible protein DinB [Jannaschia seohaensis]SSA44612.1 Uncharacterized damage-inducible protein DinB (forms a four-helix bundle) [Jannaschia seohaensis]
MIGADWVRMMARYAAWQNASYAALTADLSEADWWADRGAFFKSLGVTANHILWADKIWLSRLGGGQAPAASGVGLDIAATRADWAAQRAKADADLSRWAAGLRDADLRGDLEWVSVLAGDMRAPLAEVVTHLFNHATHHRGQMHAMLTAMGRETPVTDIPFMPAAT